ncbi:MAG: tripartite tricarboxylate transporter substrate binding protein [Albidovulum sp.]|nr:tripartite tricarboxylate transporter substrate binding protein [Albidovulum sp.]MDE0531832.1 tripartite tricarboxylate transporter substrate binding protein [Albidovulum sp.]
MVPNLRHFVSYFAASAIALAVSLAAAHADYPEKPIEFIIPFGAGGGADIEGRLLATEMGNVLGVNLIPINKVGGGGAVAYTHTKNAAPDGYTVVWNSTSILTTTNIGNVDFGYDALDHVGRVEWQPMPFAVSGDSRWDTFEEFVAECRENPGSLKVSNSGSGSATHLGAIALMDAAGCEVTHLPVGISRRNATVLSGEADAMIAPLTGAVNLTKAGKLKLLVMPSGVRNPVMPDVPTARELGFDVALDLFRGLSVPKGTPDDVKAKLANAMAEAAQSAEFMDLAMQKGFTVDPLDSAAFGEILEVDDAMIKSILENADLGG